MQSCAAHAKTGSLRSVLSLPHPERSEGGIREAAVAGQTTYARMRPVLETPRRSGESPLIFGQAGVSAQGSEATILRYSASVKAFRVWVVTLP
jgi:hypothetical protein